MILIGVGSCSDDYKFANISIIMSCTLINGHFKVNQMKLCGFPTEAPWVFIQMYVIVSENRHKTETLTAFSVFDLETRLHLAYMAFLRTGY